MNTLKSIPLRPDRQRLFQFKFRCKPTPKHPCFFTLGDVDFFVWLLDETIGLAEERARRFVAIFPFTHDRKISAVEIKESDIAAGEYQAGQLEFFVKARKVGIFYGFFPVKGSGES